MKRIIAEIPRPALIAIAVILAALVAFGVLLPILGGNLSDAIARNTTLKGDIDLTRKNLTQSKADEAYVRDHQAEFEALLKSDKLIPHTRRAAVLELTNVGRSRGLSALNYSFNAASATSLKAVSSQPQSGAYSVSLESIELKIGAPFDGPVYRFIGDITSSFPGSIIVESLELHRADVITPLALEAISRGQDSQLVTGDIHLSWRTAQAEQKEIQAQTQTGKGK